VGTVRKKKKANISLSAGAKITAVAKASYARKKTTTEAIPPDVTRAKAGAWLDLISPLTEWAGLKGDALRFKRTLLRLQREDILFEIVRRARKKIGNLSHLKPIPNKFLVPFLEQASLEDPESSLIDMWASLLSSAAQNFSSYHTHFVSIISRLSAKQGLILKSIIGTEDAHGLERAMDNLGLYGVFQSYRIRKEIEEIASKLTERTDDAFFSEIETLFNHVGIEVIHCAAENLATKAYYDLNFSYRDYKEDDAIDYAILEAVGLIKRIEIDFFDVKDWAISLNYYHLTELGFHFAVACGIVRSDRDSIQQPDNQ
jgi:hypothetical protein